MSLHKQLLKWSCGSPFCLSTVESSKRSIEAATTTAPKRLLYCNAVARIAEDGCGGRGDWRRQLPSPSTAVHTIGQIP